MTTKNRKPARTTGRKASAPAPLNRAARAFLASFRLLSKSDPRLVERFIDGLHAVPDAGRVAAKGGAK